MDLYNNYAAVEHYHEIRTWKSVIAFVCVFVWVQKYPKYV